MSKVIIEVRQNELRSKNENAHIPYTAAEIARSALDSHAEGAAIAHFHGRTEDGAESSALESFAEAIATIRADSSMLIHPTLGRFERGADPLLRFSVVEALATTPALRPDIAPLDLGSLNLDVFDHESRTFVADDLLYQNSARDLRGMAARIRELGMRPQLVIYGLSGIRLMDAFIATGDISPPAYVTFVLTGPSLIFGHPATSEGLRAYVRNLTSSDVHWSVMIAGQSYMPMLHEILEAGGHICIGLGDYAYPELDSPSNALIVRKVVEAAREVGRDVASSEEVSEMLDILPAG